MAYDNKMSHISICNCVITALHLTHMRLVSFVTDAAMNTGAHAASAANSKFDRPAGDSIGNGSCIAAAESSVNVG